jgi:hypothetical protein
MKMDMTTGKNVAIAEVVRCKEHGEASCWQQSDGSHISRHACSCDRTPPYLCPIDAHAIKYLVNNPEWVDEAPIRHTPPPPKPHPQDCEHRGDKELVELPGGIRSWLCKACRKELVERTQELRLPPTPIELYAARRKPKETKEMIGIGCKYTIGKVKEKPIKNGKPVMVDKSCGLICDRGETLCPRHMMIAAAKEAQKDAQQEEKRRKKREAQESENTGVNA